MAGMLGDEGYEATTRSALQAPLDADDADDAPSSDAKAMAMAKFEHEVAALDLSEAEQLATWSAAMAEQGDAAESQRLADHSARLTESAHRHRQRAERLEGEADPGV
ncbi:MAG: hypothetical protein ABI112_16220 [Terracoccus sp.]